MNEQENISDVQYAMLFFVIVVATIVLFVPQVLAEQAGQSAWVVPFFIPTVVGLVAFLAALKLSLGFPGMTLPQYLEKILGKPLAKVIGVSYILFQGLTYVIIIREYTDFINITVLPSTPRYVLVLTAVILGSYAASKSLEVVARATQFVLPLFLGFSIFVLLLSSPDAEPGNLLPLFKGGFGPIMKASFVPTAWYGEIALFVLFLPFVNKPKTLKFKGSIVIILLSLFIGLETVITIMVFGADITRSRMFPLWSLSTYIEFENYIHRVESFLVVVWLALIYLKMAIFSYMIFRTTVQVLGVKNRKWLVQLFLALAEIFSATFFLTNITDVKQLTINFFTPVAIVMEIAMPIFLLSVAWLRKKMKKT